MPRRSPKTPSGGGSSPGAFGLASGYDYGISRCGEDRTFGAEAGQGLNPAQAMRRVARSKPLEFGEFFEVFDAKGTAAKVSMAKPPVRLSHFARPGRFERRQIPPPRTPMSKGSENIPGRARAKSEARGAGPSRCEGRPPGFAPRPPYPKRASERELPAPLAPDRAMAAPASASASSRKPSTSAIRRRASAHRGGIGPARPALPGIVQRLERDPPLAVVDRLADGSRRGGVHLQLPAQPPHHLVPPIPAPGRRRPTSAAARRGPSLSSRAGRRRCPPPTRPSLPQAPRSPCGPPPTARRGAHPRQHRTRRHRRRGRPCSPSLRRGDPRRRRALLPSSPSAGIRGRRRRRAGVPRAAETSSGVIPNSTGPTLR